MTAVDWDHLETWGKPGHNVPVSDAGSDVRDGHDVSEAMAEAGRG